MPRSNDSTTPPYQRGTRYCDVPVYLTQVYATITDRNQRGTRYCFTLPQHWHGYYEVPNGTASRFIERLMAEHPQPIIITFTVTRVIPLTTEVYLGHPVFVRRA